tara:strand:+ start:360 stop:533 length:174 start_codon:yes stop_codon:yes gene_type:complete
VKKEITGIGVTLFLDNDTTELTIHSVINSSSVSDAGMESGDEIQKIYGKSTNGMGLK